ncbi:amidohydrolase [Microtetraspora fusca]|uniref:Amidohydrolase n=1 Tax=Microtetraspora fusca TaxID=1997 RepID=A0ABW6VMQ3_MICFU
MENILPRRAVLTAGALAAAVAATDVAFAPAAGAAADPADIVLTDGYIYTVDAHDSVHQALAVSGGRIVYVGTTKGAARYVGKATKVVNLHGRMVMPGLHDGHLHEMSGGKGLLDCDLKYAALTVEEFQATIQEYLDRTAEHEPDGWGSVVHWYQQAIRPAGTKLTRADLDALNTKRPIVVESSDGHTILVNSRALELAGITAKTPNPPDGVIERDKEGWPTGILQDGASNLVDAKIPRPTRAENLKIARTALAALAEQGVTTFMDAIATEDALRAFTTLAEQGRLTARAHFAHLVEVTDTDPIPELKRLRRKYDGGPIKAGPRRTQRQAVRDSSAPRRERLLASLGRGRRRTSPARFEQQNHIKEAIPLPGKPGGPLA